MKQYDKQNQNTSLGKRKIEKTDKYTKCCKKNERREETKLRKTIRIK